MTQPSGLRISRERGFDIGLLPLPSIHLPVRIVSTLTLAGADQARVKRLSSCA
jgi:hypothetical protein